MVTGPAGDGRRSPVLLQGCGPLQEALAECRLVVLTATESEAVPLAAALEDPEHYLVAGKTLLVGRLRLDGRRSAHAGKEPGVRTALAICGCDKANTAHMLTCLLQAMAALPGLPALVMQVGIAGAFVSTPPLSPQMGDVVLATEEIYADTGSSSPEGWLSADDLGLPIGCSGGESWGNRFPLNARLVKAAATAVRAIAVGSGNEAAHDGTTAAETAGGGEAMPEGEPARGGGSAPMGKPAPGGSAPAGADRLGALLPGRVFMGPCLTASQVTGTADEAEVLSRRWGALAESMEGAAAAHICALYDTPFLEVRGISNLIGDRDRSSWQIDRAVRASATAALTICAAFRGSILGSQGEAQTES